jgi:hypothetical protein
MIKEVFGVEVANGKAYVWGRPQGDDESHDCDAMGCPSTGHIVAIVPLVSSRGEPVQADQPAVAQSDVWKCRRCGWMTVRSQHCYNPECVGMRAIDSVAPDQQDDKAVLRASFGAGSEMSRLINAAEQRTADQQTAGALPLWKPYRIEGRWPYWQCATPHGPYTFDAESQEAAEAHCAKERAAHQQEVAP